MIPTSAFTDQQKQGASGQTQEQPVQQSPYIGRLRVENDKVLMNDEGITVVINPKNADKMLQDYIKNEHGRENLAKTTQQDPPVDENPELLYNGKKRTMTDRDHMIANIMNCCLNMYTLKLIKEKIEKHGLKWEEYIQIPEIKERIDSAVKCNHDLSFVEEIAREQD